MFLLKTPSLPASAAELQRHLNESLRRLFVVERDPAEVTDESYPALRSLRITLDRARLREGPPRPQQIGPRTAALRVADLSVDAAQLDLGPASVDLKLHGREVAFEQAGASEDEILLLPCAAASGEIEISAARSEIEAAIARIAGREAGRHGVAIENVRLTLRERGPRNLSGTVELKARKLFFSAVIRIAADLDLDENLNARLSGLSCAGEGAIGSLVCGFIAPHLKRLNNRSFPLLNLPLGKIRLRNITLSAAENLRVRAEFGSGDK